MLSALTILWSLACIGLVTSSPTGPPASACVSMAPSHGSQAQTSTAPYTLSFSKNTYTYSPNEQITVTLSGKNSETFRGFLIQPRTNVNTLSIVGTFSNIPGDARPLQCTDSVTQTTMFAVCHNSGSDKPSVSFTWTAPSQDVGPIYFVYTVVKIKTTYWVKAQADQAFTFQSDIGATGTQQPTGGATGTPTTTTPLPNIVINWDPDCGHTKGCYPTSNECHINCDYLVKWKPVNNETVEFSLQRRSAGDKWIAIGFSDNRGMGNDSVVECSSVGGTVAVHSSFNIVKNPNNNNIALSVDTLGISNAVTSHIDGILSCSFRRKISADLIATATPDDATKFFDLNTPWYLLVSWGDMFGTNKMKHATGDPKITTEKIDFLSVVADTTPAPPAPGPAGEIVKPAACGKTQGCFHDCDSTGKACTFYFGFETNGDDTCMTLHCKQGTNRYCAIGFSSDQQMGDDYVIEAVADGSKVNVYSSFNTGQSNERLSPGTFGISQQSCSYQDGVISCSFCRKTVFAASGRRKRAAVSSSNYFDLNTDWYLFYAYGSAAGVAIQQHDVNPVSSPQKADLQSVQELGAQAVGMATLVLVHAILMIASWMLFATVGIVAPRFYKPAWPQDTKLCGLAVWFTIHRTCMVMAFLCCAVSFVVIFVHVGGYADDIDGSNFEKAHPIMGIVVMALALINPIMALFRPHPGTSKRPIFNGAHLIVGTVAYVVAIVNIFAGVAVAEEKVPDYVRIILYVFCGWIGLFSVVLHIYECTTRKTEEEGSVPILDAERNRGESYELKGPESRDSTIGLTEIEVGHDMFKVIALYIHILIVTGLAVAVCVIIGIKSGVGEGGEGGDSHE